MKYKVLPLYRYPGGKSKQTKLIRSYFPEAFSEYRECFVGGGSVFFSVNPSFKRWINDANANLISVYLALRDRPGEFIESCRSIAPAKAGESCIESRRGTQYNERLSDLFHQFVDDDWMDPALRYFFLNRLGFNGRVILEPSRRHRMYFSNPTGWNIVTTTALESAANRLHGTKVTAGDYAPLLSDSGENVVVYADPPYWRDTVLPKSGKLYQHGFQEQDHTRFRDAVLASPHRVVVSYDDCEYIRELWKKFHIHEEAWHYCGTTTKRRMGRELIITNYPVHRSIVALPAILESLPGSSAEDQAA